MWQAAGDKLKYYLCVAGLFAVSLGVRYVSFWSTDPVSPPLATMHLAPSPAIVSQDSQCTIWEIPFVTLHSFDERTGDFTGSDQQEHFGISEVLIPARRNRGSLDLQHEGASGGSSTIQRAGDREFLPDRFYEHVQERLAGSPQKDVLIFVHGFNVGFHEAVCRAAQMAHDIPFSGVMIAYDWHSADSPLGYLQDRISTSACAPHMARFLAELRARLGSEVRLHLLAHSMGNQITLEALALLGDYQPMIGGTTVPEAALVNPPALLKPMFPDWQRWQTSRLGGISQPPLTHLILAAPDVHPELFQKSLGTVQQLARRITIYSSESDFALELSRYVNGQGKTGFRLGDTRNGMDAGPVDLVRLQGVSRSDPFGHSYYGSDPRLLTDLSLLLAEDRPLEQRPTVTAGSWLNSGKWYLR